MRVSLRSPGLASSGALRAYLERRVDFALGRFGGRIASVAATLSDENGPRGGPDKLCRLVADVPGGPPLVVEVAHADAYAAVGRAAGRLGRALARQLGRRRERSA